MGLGLYTRPQTQRPGLPGHRRRASQASTALLLWGPGVCGGGSGFLLRPDLKGRGTEFPFLKEEHLDGLKIRKWKYFSY